MIQQQILRRTDLDGIFGSLNPAAPNCNRYLATEVEFDHANADANPSSTATVFIRWLKRR